MKAWVLPFCVVSLLYLWPLIAEAIAGVRKTRAGKPAPLGRRLGRSAGSASESLVALAINPTARLVTAPWSSQP